MELIKASLEHKAVIKNLMQLYMYDFSEFIDIEVEVDGLFAAYKNLDDYWNDVNRFPYIIQQGEKPIGFVFVRHVKEQQCNHFSIAEFFVMKRYRRTGTGTAVADRLFDLHKGQWEVFQKETNIPAQLFWKSVIDEYTKGDFTERFEDGKIIQEFQC
jgi:predicted acetyltransferase